MNIELWRNVKIVDTSATATKRLIKMIAVGLVTAILLATTIGHTKPMDNNNAINKYDYVKKKIKDDEGFKMLPYTLKYDRKRVEGGEKQVKTVIEKLAAQADLLEGINNKFND